MKKKPILLLIIVLLIIFIVILIRKSEYQINYKVKDYSVNEHFYNNKYYDLLINKNKYSYIINYQSTRKQKKIIKDIKMINNNNLKCIILTYKKQSKKNIACILDKEQVSIDYLIKINNSDFKTIKKKIKKLKIEYPTSDNSKTTYKSLTVYNKNISKNKIYYIWNYKGLYILDNEDNKYQEVLEYDLYDNIESCSVNDYFVLLENNSVKGIQKIYYYHNNKLNTYKLPVIISKDSYINGVVENKIYITDRKNKKEYSLDINKRKWLEIDDGNSYIIFQNNKKKTISKSDFFIKDQYFKITKINNYHYYQKDNKIYKQLNNNKVLLLELDNIKEWFIKNDEIIILQEDTIYSYNESNGIRKIVENNELKYNYHNIYQIGEK